MTLDDMIAKQAGKPTKAELEEMAKRQREASGIMTRDEMIRAQSMNKEG